MAFPRRKALVCASVMIAALFGCAGCTPERIVKPFEYDGGVACGLGQRLWLDRCICETDIACRADQVCDVITGQCVPRPDAGVPDAGTRTCLSGARRCSPGAPSTVIQECRVGAWVDVQTCSAGTCFPASTGPACTVCTPGAMRCVSGNPPAYEECKDEGTAWVPKTCPTGGVCTPKGVIVVCQICTPSTTRCSTDGKALETCNALGTAWDNQGACPYTQQCLAGPPATCKAPVCTPPTRRCSSVSPPTLEECKSDGSGYNAVDCRTQPFATAAAVCSGADSDDPGIHCHDPCAVAANTKSYMGCEYWGAVTSNSQLDNQMKGMNLDTPEGTAGSSDSEYALVVANGNAVAATVKVQWLNGGSVQDVPGKSAITIPPPTDAATKGLVVVRLPWRGVCGTGQASFAYKLTSSIPVSVYQFNPVSSSKTGLWDSSGYDCASTLNCLLAPSGYGSCQQGYCVAPARTTVYTFTNDASLMLPAHIFGTAYVVAAQQHISLKSTSGTMYAVPGFVSIVAPQDNTKVRLRLSAKVMATKDSTHSPCDVKHGDIAAQAPGIVEYTLNKYEVLQLWSASDGTPTCAPPDVSYFSEACRYPSDFTGTIITSISPSGNPASDPPKPIAVFAGADCSFNPYNMWACDHMEEQMFPFNTWGKKYVGQKTAPYFKQTCNALCDNCTLTSTPVTTPPPDTWRVVAGCGQADCPLGTKLTITPAPTAVTFTSPGAGCGGGTCTLPAIAPGATAPWIEFNHSASFVVESIAPAAGASAQPIVLAQYYPGQDSAGKTAGCTSAGEGDPALVLAPPVEQWRPNYVVLTPSTIRDNYIGIVGDGNYTVTLDGVAVTATKTPIAGTTYGTMIIPLAGATQGGAHAIQASGPVGVVVYGYDRYVSYGYTGGLDLKQVNSINPGG